MLLKIAVNYDFLFIIISSNIQPTIFTGKYSHYQKRYYKLQIHSIMHLNNMFFIILLENNMK